MDRDVQRSCSIPPKKKRRRDSQFDMEEFCPLTKYEMQLFSTDGSGDALPKSDLATSFHERYNKVVSFGSSDAYDPTSYCYVDDLQDDPEHQEFHKIKYSTYNSADSKTDHQVLPPSQENVWKCLPQEKKEELIIILSTFRKLDNLLEYCEEDDGAWRHRATPLTPENAIHRRNLEAYGDPDLAGKKFFELLLGDRSWKEVQQEYTSGVATNSRMSRLTEKFCQVWEKALHKQMTSGAAIDAVMKSIEFVADLLYDMPESTLPAHCLPLNIDHITSDTSPKADDSFSISDIDRNSSVKDSDSDSDASTKGELNRKRLSQKSKRGSVAESCTPNLKKDASGLPRHSRKYIDLAVSCSDPERGEGKYILLVKIYSHDSGYNHSLGKFKQELVHVLQGQTEVFGLFISNFEFRMFRAKRSCVNNIITIFSEPNPLITAIPDSDIQHIRVAQFQNFMIDTFSCLVYGITKIEV